MNLSICWKKKIIIILSADNVLDSKLTAKIPPVLYIIFWVYLSVLGLSLWYYYNTSLWLPCFVHHGYNCWTVNTCTRLSKLIILTCLSLQDLPAWSEKAATGPETAVALFLYSEGWRQSLLIPVDFFFFFCQISALQWGFNSSIF